MKKWTTVVATLAFAGLAVAPASAQVTFHGDVSPTGNYASWLATVTGYGGSLTTLTFSGHALGTLNPNFYPGVTLTATSPDDQITTGTGPNDGNTSSTPLSSGEGPHAASEYLRDSPAFSTFTVSFANPVFGAGLFIIDHFNPDGDDAVTLEAFTGQNGTGTSLGFFNSVSYNFQPDNMYYMGIASGSGDIGSIVLTDGSGATGDTYGIDDVSYATGTTVTPEPASLLLLATGLGGLAMFRRKRKA